MGLARACPNTGARPDKGCNGARMQPLNRETAAKLDTWSMHLPVILLEDSDCSDCSCSVQTTIAINTPIKSVLIQRENCEIMSQTAKYCAILSIKVVTYDGSTPIHWGVFDTCGALPQLLLRAHRPALRAGSARSAESRVGRFLWTPLFPGRPREKSIVVRGGRERFMRICGPTTGSTEAEGEERRGKRISLRARVVRFILNRADLLVAIIRIVVAIKNLFSS